MALTTITKIRFVSDLTTSDISDADLTLLIAEIERIFWQFIAVRTEDEKPDGTIDNSNREFRSQKYPICPTGATTAVSTTDILIYGIHSNATTGFDESTQLTVSTVYANDGRFRLSSAPDNSTYDELRMHYSYTGFNIDWDKVSTAMAYLTAFFAYGGKFTSGEYENVKFMDLSISQGSKSADNKSKANSMKTNFGIALKSLQPRRFRDKRIRPQSFIQNELNASKRADRFQNYYSR